MLASFVESVECLTICLFLLLTELVIEAYVGFRVLVELACCSRDVLSSVILFSSSSHLLDCNSDMTSLV